MAAFGEAWCCRRQALSVTDMKWGLIFSSRQALLRRHCLHDGGLQGVTLLLYDVCCTRRARLESVAFFLLLLPSPIYILGGTPT